MHIVEFDSNKALKHGHAHVCRESFQNELYEPTKFEEDINSSIALYKQSEVCYF